MDSAATYAKIDDECGNSCSYSKDNESCSDLNSSLRLHISQCSSISSEGDLSLCIDQELNMLTNRIIDADELPAFEIRLISPLSRSPSPIDSDMDFDTPTRSNTTPRNTATPNYRLNHPDFVTLQDINSQISPPSDNDESTTISRANSLETIFEGVFLNTPPRQRKSECSRSSMLEKVVLNRLNFGKENAIPASQLAITKMPLKLPDAYLPIKESNKSKF